MTIARLRKLGAFGRGGLVVSDTFTRADGALGTAETGQSWSVLSGAPVIVSNRYSTLGALNDHVAVVDVGAANVRVTADLNSGSTASGAWLVFRATTAGNYLMARIPSSGAVQLYKVVAGAATQLASTGSFTISATHAFEVILSGPSVRVRVNGVEYISATETFNETATKYGINTTEAAAYADNFRVYR